MPAAILSILGPLVPYILGIFGIVVAYFTVKQRGVTQERQRQEAVQQKAQAEVVQRVQVAQSKDAAIDAKVEAKVEEITKAEEPAAPSAPGKFRF